MNLSELLKLSPQDRRTASVVRKWFRELTPVITQGRIIARHGGELEKVEHRLRDVGASEEDWTIVEKALKTDVRTQLIIQELIGRHLDRRGETITRYSRRVKNLCILTASEDAIQSSRSV